MTLPVMTMECKAVRDPELRFTPAGKAVANLRVVASDRRKNPETEQWEDSATLWLEVTAWDKLAENVAESVQQGDDLVVVGKLKTEEWDDKDTGAKRSKVTCTAYSVARNMRWHPVPHGAKAERSTPASSPAAGGNDPWSQAGAAQSDEPPF